MVLRAIVVYFLALLTIKLGKKRLMGKNSPMDVVVMIILGAVLSRAIIGSSPFIGTIAASLAFVMVHRAMSWLASRSQRLADLLEGKRVTLVSNGAIDWDAMRKYDITEKDLCSALRLSTHNDSLSDVNSVYLEPNGRFSVVKKVGLGMPNE